MGVPVMRALLFWVHIRPVTFGKPLYMYRRGLAVAGRWPKIPETRSEGNVFDGFCGIFCSSSSSGCADRVLYHVFLLCFLSAA